MRGGVLFGRKKNVLAKLDMSSNLARVFAQYAIPEEVREMILALAQLECMRFREHLYTSSEFVETAKMPPARIAHMVRCVFSVAKSVRRESVPISMKRSAFERDIMNMKVAGSSVESVGRAMKRISAQAATKFSSQSTSQRFELNGDDDWADHKFCDDCVERLAKRDDDYGFDSRGRGFSYHGSWWYTRARFDRDANKCEW